MYFLNMLNIAMYKTSIQNYNDKEYESNKTNSNKFYNVNNNTTTNNNYFKR